MYQDTGLDIITLVGEWAVSQEDDRFALVEVGSTLNTVITCLICYRRVSTHGRVMNGFRPALLIAQ